MHRWLGLLRSLLIYYGIPWRHYQLRRFYAQFIQPGDLCFDVGAHVGNRLAAWHALGATAVALEPQPLFMRFLRLTYGRHPHIHLLPQAVGAQTGQQTLHISHRHPTVTTLSSNWISQVSQQPTFAQVSWNTAVTVPITTLDTLIDRFGLPDFCKIDVEGYELEVLRGLSQPIPALSFEYIPHTLDLAHACVTALETIAPHQYRYNWTIAEQHRWQSDTWLTAAAMHQAITHILATNPRSGDIYAQLKPTASG